VGRCPWRYSVINDRLAAMLDRVAAWLRRPSRGELRRRQVLAALVPSLPHRTARIVRALVDGEDASAVVCELVALELAGVTAALAKAERTAALRHAALHGRLAAV
jgi:hypothetical protein